MNTLTPPSIIITPRGVTSLAEWRELWTARDLLWFLIRRDLKTRYSQSVLGLGWAVVQPLFTTLVFTLIFGNVPGITTDGVPYSVWSMTAIVLWTYFQSSVNESGNCLSGNIGMITKVYFPRMVLPLAAVLGKLFDLAIMLGILGLTLAIAHHQPEYANCHPQLAALWAVPVALLVAVLGALGLGLWLAALSVQYRDVRVAQGFLLQLMLFVSPIIRDLSDKFSPTWRPLYFFNPLAGPIVTMRAALLGSGPIPWPELALSAAVAVVFLISGLWCFRRSENIVADVA